MFAIVSEVKVESVEERKEKYNYRKTDDKGGYTHDERSIGWFIRILGSSAIGPFGDKPDLQKGDTLIMQLRKKQ